MSRSVVIVGAGQAGYQTAISLRQGGFSDDIVLIGDEPFLPYQRPPLSKAYLLGKIDVDGLIFRSTEFYEQQKIQLIHGKATAVDRTNKRVQVADGTSFDYGHLILATGARNRPFSVPGSDARRVHGLRSMKDANDLKQEIAEARHAVVVGAGFIGLEFAAVARSLGLEVDILDMADRAMARAVSDQVSQFFADAHSAWGSRLRFRRGVAHIDTENGRAASVQTTAGESIPAELVVYGIGVIPNTELAIDAGLEVANGILVDSYLVTSDSDISAIGDCVLFPSVHAGGQARLESVQNAVDQGRAVAARLLGKPDVYGALPWFWSDQADLKLQMVGLSTGYDETVMLGRTEDRSFTNLLFRKRQLIAIECVNRAGDFMAARKMMSQHVTLTPDVASRPGFELRSWKG